MGERRVHVPMAASRCTAGQAPALATTATPAVEHHDYCEPEAAVVAGEHEGLPVLLAPAQQQKQQRPHHLPRRRNRIVPLLFGGNSSGRVGRA